MVTVTAWWIFPEFLEVYVNSVPIPIYLLDYSLRLRAFCLITRNAPGLVANNTLRFMILFTVLTFLYTFFYVYRYILMSRYITKRMYLNSRNDK
jgi:hypothetical protein